MNKRFYYKGRVFEEVPHTVEINGKPRVYYTYEQLPHLTCINGKEYLVPPWAPNPFVYGAKNIVIAFRPGDKWQRIYRAKTGTIEENYFFKGSDWVFKEKPEYVDTLTDRIQQTMRDTIDAIKHVAPVGAHGYPMWAPIKYKRRTNYGVKKYPGGE